MRNNVSLTNYALRESKKTFRITPRAMYLF